ncbi:MAG: hypothetical protein WDO24_04890 [Pseudomonadota bacterium]
MIDDSGASGAVTVDLGAPGIAAKTVIGSAFNDLLTGSSLGGTVFVGNAGNDTLMSQGSQDTLTGGAGGDVFTFTSATATGSVITDFQSDTDGIDLRPVLAAINYHGTNPLGDGTISFASVAGGTAIMLSADDNAADAHLLATVQGVSTLQPWDFYLPIPPPPPPPPAVIDDSGAPGAVTVDLDVPGIAAKTVIGSAFNDLLTGSQQGGTVFVGNAGNDTLVSQGSHDTLTGGMGGDVFTFASATATGSVITRLPERHRRHRPAAGARGDQLSRRRSAGRRHDQLGERDRRHRDHAVGRWQCGRRASAGDGGGRLDPAAVGFLSAGTAAATAAAGGDRRQRRVRRRGRRSRRAGHRGPRR